MTYTKQTIFAKAWLLLAPVHLADKDPSDDNATILPRHNLGWRWLQLNIAAAQWLGWAMTGREEYAVSDFLWLYRGIPEYDVLVPEDEA